MSYIQYEARINQLQEELRLLRRELRLIREEQRGVLVGDMQDLLLAAASAATRALRRHGPLTKKNIKGSISTNYRRTSILTPALDYLQEQGIIEKEGSKYQLTVHGSNTRST